MKLLLDTHAFLWFYLGDAKLSPNALSLILDPQHEKVVSPIVYWEIAIKVSLGKLKFATSYQSIVEDGIHNNGFSILPIETRHTSILTGLPFHHRDPFDRLLIAQAIGEQAAIVSKDSLFDLYPISRFW